MVYGEMGTETLRWANHDVFGLNSADMPSSIVITPFKVEEYFEDLRATLTKNAVKYKKAGNSFLIHRDCTRTLFAKGASNFADSSYFLCHCTNVKKIIFVGTGGGIGGQVKSTDINVPPSCVRLDKVLEILLPLKTPATADAVLAGELRRTVSESVLGLVVGISSGTHATVLFFLSETKQLLTNLQKQGVVSVDRSCPCSTH